MRQSGKAGKGNRRLYATLNAAVLAAMLLAQSVAPIVAAPARAPVQASANAGSGAGMKQLRSSGGTGGLDITLSQGSASAQSAVTTTVAATEPLTPEETQALLDRLPPLEAETEDAQEFNFPPESLAPPTVADTIETTFPASAPDGANVPVVETETGDLEVSRYAPEGAISMAPFLQVTFSQPMVPLGTLAELAEEDVPVQLTPELPGIWRWLGTQTLTFEYSGDVDRFPMATEYTAVIPAGTTSATGGVLQDEVSWTFSTPSPRVISSSPNGGPTSLNPLLFVAFDQLVDPAAILDVTTVTANGTEIDVRLAAEQEVAEDPRVSTLAKNAGDGRWLAFRATDELPGDATINVNIGPNTPSAEGPLTTPGVQSFSFYTYGPLRITDARCSWGGATCPLGSPFTIQFNNPIDLVAVNNDWVTVSPELPGMTVSAWGDSLSISGAQQGRTEYTVTVLGDVKDIFGQTLGSEQSFKFTTDRGYPYLTSASGNFVTVDPAGDPTFSVFSMNYGRLHVRLYAVEPSDWSDWQEYQRTYWDQKPAPPPGELVYEETVNVAGDADALSETVIDLKNGLGDRATGHLVVIVDIPRPLFGERDRASVQAWVQVTTQAVDAFSDATTLLGWVTTLAEGTPIVDAHVELWNTGEEATTDESGQVTFALDNAPGKLLISTIGEGDAADVAMIPYSQWDYWGDSGWQKQSQDDQLLWYIFDDRQMYRPGEEVHVKGWLRRVGTTPSGDVGLLGDAGATVRYTVSDPLGVNIGEGVAELSDLNGFDFDFAIPAGANLGGASIYLTANGVSDIYYLDNYYSFQIQEFRRPEFSVAAQPEGMGPWYLNDEGEVSVSAQYYAGGPLSNAETTWTVTSSAASYSPPNWSEFTFGTWTPWWWYGGGDVYSYEGDFGGSSGLQGSQTLTGTTDATGKHYLHMSFDRSTQPRPYTVNASAVVMDVNRQAWSANTSILVHPAELYVGIRSDASFVEQGDPLDVEVIVTDVDGNAVPETPVTLHMALKKWVFENGQWVQQDQDEQSCEVVSGNEPESCTFETTTGGEYRIWAEVRDDRERLNRSEFTRWVSGGQSVPSRTLTMEQVSLIPDKQDYAVGDTAEILVQSPFSPASGLVTVARNGFVYSFPVELREDATTTTLLVPIEEEYIPGVSVQVDLVGSAPRLDADGNEMNDVPERPAYAQGSLALNIPPVTRTLTLDVQPAATALAPGEETSLDVTVTDANGDPVEDAELAIVVVDEAVLALTGYQIPDPLVAFYRASGSGIQSLYTRSSVVLIDPSTLASSMGGRGGGGGEGMAMAESAMDMAAPSAAPMATMAPMNKEVAEESETSTPQGEMSDTPIDVRTNFNPLAIFAPNVRTDADGHASVSYTMPDNLTRYRVTVVAATEKQFGMSEENVTARLPLMVRPSAPRFLNFGDVFEFPIVVQNQTDEAMSVAIAMRTTNLDLAEDVGQRVEIPANDRVEVRFPAASESAGTARFQVAVATGDLADAANGELPVYTPATTEAFATYGVIDEGAIVQPMNTPDDVFPQFGGLEVSASSTALSELTDAVLYLRAYPFECSEQTASRILAIASLRDVLTAFNAAGLPSPVEINAAVERDITKLVGMQNVDGGFPVWERGDDSIPYYSIYATHALQVARSKDYAVPQEALDAARDHLRRIEQYYPSWYSQMTKQTLSSYAVYVRDLMGDTDAAKAREIYHTMPIEDQSLEALGWLWQVMADDASSTTEVDEIRTHVNNSAIENASEANFFTSYGDQAYVMLHSNRRTDAILLDAIINDSVINDEVDNPLIPKIVNGLMAARIQGRWNNTQENTFVLLALDRYFNTYENVEPDFIARVWLGDTYVAENTFEGYDAATQNTLVPMQYVVDAPADPDITIQKDGADGRLYYRLGLSYAPTDLTLDPLDMGFTVQRVYEAVDDPGDVTRDEEGVWHFKAGARVKVSVTMVTTNRRYNVALVDPLPAGLEAINPALAVSADVSGITDPTAKPYGWWWYSTWYEHENLRDSRAEAFTTVLWDGVYQYEYVARATTPGTFVVPPAKAEEMYTPEVFGRSGSDKVIVE